MSERPPSYRVATDTGGTFTDFVVFDESDGTYRIMKVPSSPLQPDQALLTGLTTLAEQGVPSDAISVFTHGTTVGTNALLEERGARVGLAVTRGFRGVYEAMEQSRPFGPSVFDLGYTKPALLAAESDTVEVTERLAASGAVLEPVSDEEVAEAVRRFSESGVESVAVSLLFSFLNDEHEQRLADALRKADPNLWVTTSSELLPQMREYVRLSTTVINAYVSPVVGRYVGRLSAALERLGVAPGRRFTMQSNGGSVPFDRTPDRGVATILSGPAGGVTASVAISRAVGIEDLITFDMGGTSCDVALVQGGEPTVSDQNTLEGRHIAVPMLDINTVSAGGGTVAVVDPHGSLHVGPRSAGAVPGPAAYGKGGQTATVTDANVVLGYLNPVSLLDGDLAVDAAAAERVVAEVAAPLGVDTVRAADGIVRIVNVKMGQAIRSISTERGFDLRDFTLVAFGGAGPLHASQIALDLGIPRVLVPPSPGATSALGLLMSDVKHDLVRSRLTDVSELRAQDANSLFEQMHLAASKQLAQEGFSEDSTSYRYFLDMRYSGQGYENPVPVRTVPLTEEDLTGYRRDFDAIHEQCHGHAAPDQSVEVVNYRVQAIGLVPPVSLPTVPPAEGPVTGAVTGSRPAYFPDTAGGTGSYVPTPVYARAKLGAGHRVTGPAVVEQYDSTVVVFPEQWAEVDHYGNLLITKVPSAEERSSR
ncbi:hydantoinase/oxoprolinase family protein [Streptomyces sp. 8L]|uniref:hydantoinase/oxoprolinase family protein n=1 Tax=Streptomyces sp. 8L TaxID=2877242 RepID=UPI001CD6E7BB|nr:hydantoinase/oxoprolinase family protein [Streptomyces sp. 8L]MCA1218555.1 hydantoinase/oxoprolinase family protein [Streptomyces sp. 8L]